MVQVCIDWIRFKNFTHNFRVLYQGWSSWWRRHKGIRGTNVAVVRLWLPHSERIIGPGPKFYYVAYRFSDQENAVIHMATLSPMCSGILTLNRLVPPLAERRGLIFLISQEFASRTKQTPSDTRSSLALVLIHYFFMFAEYQEIDKPLEWVQSASNWESRYINNVVKVRVFWVKLRCINKSLTREKSTGTSTIKVRIMCLDFILSFCLNVFQNSSGSKKFWGAGRSTSQNRYSGLNRRNYTQKLERSPNILQ